MAPQVTVLVVVEALAIVLLGLLVAGLLRSHAEILRRLHALDGGAQQADGRAGAVDLPFVVRPGVVPPSGAPLPRAHDIVGVTPDEEAVLLSVRAGPTLLAFLTSGCLTCQRFWTAFAQGEQGSVPARLVVLTKDPAEESQARVRELAPTGVTVVMSSAAWQDYQVPGSPYFLYLNDSRVLGEGTAPSWRQVVELLGQASADQRVDADPLDADRPARVDRELSAAGIRPGDASLYPHAETDLYDDPHGGAR